MAFIWNLQTKTDFVHHYFQAFWLGTTTGALVAIVISSVILDRVGRPQKYDINECREMLADPCIQVGRIAISEWVAIPNEYILKIVSKITSMCTLACKNANLSENNILTFQTSVISMLASIQLWCDIVV